MKILISADIEGVAGVFHPEQTRSGNNEYEKARFWLTSEANSAVKGAFDAGADEVYLTDSHGTCGNFILNQLDYRVKLIQGKPRYLGMMAGLELKPDGVFMVGYHSKAKSQGILAHTINGMAFSRIWVNGQEYGETGLYAALAGEFSAPVLLVSGDNCLKQEALAVLPQTRFVEVKQAYSANSGISLTPEQSCKAIYDTAFKAIALPSQVIPFQLQAPFICRLQTQNPVFADLFCQLPFTKRVESDILEFETDSMQALIRILNSFSAMSFMLK